MNKNGENNERLRKAGYFRLYHSKERKEVLFHYSKGKMCCGLCGNPDDRVLTIDHENGGGNYDRKKNGVSLNIYHWLKINNYPEGFLDLSGEFHRYRALCRNCNFLEYLKTLKTEVNLERKLCSCGCGSVVENPGCLYIYGHKNDEISRGKSKYLKTVTV